MFLEQLIEGLHFVSAQYILAIIIFQLFLSSGERQVRLRLKQKFQTADTKLPAQQETGTDLSQSASRPEPGTFASELVGGRLTALTAFRGSNSS